MRTYHTRGECDIIIVLFSRYGRVNMNRFWNMPKNIIWYYTKKLEN